MASAKQYRYMGNHAQELQVGDTRPQVGEGDFVDLTDEDAAQEHNKALIDAGLLVSVAEMEKQFAAQKEADDKAAKEAGAEEAAAQAAQAEEAATTTEKKGGK